jgi:hypothetical protein
VEDDQDDPAPTYDEEEGMPAAGAQPPATIPERTAEAEVMARRRSLASSMRSSTLSSVSASGNTTTNTTSRVSLHQYQQRPPLASASADVDGSGDSDEAAARGHSLSSFPSFHTTQALPSEEVGITVVEDVRALGHVENHVLVLLPKAVDKIQYLLRPLRAQFLKGTPFCKSVVFLTEAGVGALERHCRSLEVCGIWITDSVMTTYILTPTYLYNSPPPTRAARTTPSPRCPSTSTWWRASPTRPGTSGGRVSRRPTLASSWRTAPRCRCVRMFLDRGGFGVHMKTSNTPTKTNTHTGDR